MVIFMVVNDIHKGSGDDDDKNSDDNDDDGDHRHHPMAQKGVPDDLIRRSKQESAAPTVIKIRWTIGSLIKLWWIL